MSAICRVFHTVQLKGNSLSSRMRCAV